jgi:hypothetical protein
MSEDRIEAAILALVEARGPDKSICPSEAAREAFLKTWQTHAPCAQCGAVHLARQGKMVILRKGKPVDPENFKGVYRLAKAPDAPAPESDG